MNIAFDAAGMLGNNAKKEGVCNYILSILGTMIENDEKDCFFCMNLYDEPLDTDWEIRYQNYREISYYTGDTIEILRMPKYETVLAKLIEDFISEYKIDVFIFTAIYDPIYTIYKKQWFNNTNCVTIVYNLDHVFDKEKVLISRKVQKRYNDADKILLWSKLCLVINRNIKKALIRYLNVESGKIRVIDDIDEYKNIEWTKKLKSSKIIHEIICDMRNVGFYKKSTIKRVEKLAVFSPLLPIESGIADYSYYMIVEMSKKISVDVYIDNGYIPNPRLPENVKVFRHYEFVENYRDYDRVIYMVGNNLFHTYIFDYIKEFPGIVDIHDLNIHGEISILTGGIKAGQAFCSYYKALREDLSESETNEYICQRLSNQTPVRQNMSIFNGVALNYAEKIIVHNDYAKRWIEDKDPRYNVGVITLPKYLKKSEKVRKKTEIIYAAFGHITPAKRIDQLIKAFYKFSKQYDNVRLYLVGEPHEIMRRQLSYYCSKEYLGKRLMVTGYVSEQIMQEYLDKTDVCINLRYPYMGETSGTMTQAFCSGKCVVVNNIGFFEDLPDDTCIKIPNVENMTKTEEIEKIYHALLWSYDDAIRENKGQAAYEYAKKHMDYYIQVPKYINEITNTRHRPYSNTDLRKIVMKDKRMEGSI